MLKLHDFINPDDYRQYLHQPFKGLVEVMGGMEEGV